MSEPAAAVVVTPSPGESKTVALRKRTASTLTLWAAVIATLAIGWAPGILIFTAVSALAGLYEFYRSLECGGLPCDRRAGMVTGVIFFAVGLPVLAIYGPLQTMEFELIFFIGALLGLCIRQLCVNEAPHPGSVARVGSTLLGLLYTGWMMFYVAKIFYLAPAGGPASGVFYVFYLLVVTKFSDTGAYLLGSAIGKHKMIPRISPGKTWEGFCGALLLAAIGSVSLVLLFPTKLAPLTLWSAVWVGLGLGLAAVVGDLVESLFKRATCVKDSGALLPGIGGILDLIDSVLFTAPLFFFYLRFAVV